MKDFTRRSFQIARSPTEVKLVYTGFLIFALIGYLTFVLIGLLRIGPGYEQIVVYYRGMEDEELFPRTFGQLLEVAHFHAFIEGVVLLVLAHLLVATSLRRDLQRWVILLAFGGTLADLAAPWLIRYAAPGFAWLQLASWVVIGGTALVLVGAPLYDMWWMRRKR